MYEGNMQGSYYLICLSNYNAHSNKNNILKTVMENILVYLFFFYL